MREYTPDELTSLMISTDRLKNCHEINQHVNEELLLQTLILAQIDPKVYAEHAFASSKKFYERMEEGRVRQRAIRLRDAEYRQSRRWINRIKGFFSK